MEDQETADLRAGDGGLAGEVAVHLLDAVLHQIINGIFSGQRLIGSVGEIATLRPVANRVEVNVDKGGDKRASISESDSFFDVREEFELVLDEFWGEQLTALEPSDIPGAVEDLELAVAVEEPGISGVDPTIRPLCLGRRCGIFIIA